MLEMPAALLHARPRPVPVPLRACLLLGVMLMAPVIGAHGAPPETAPPSPRIALFAFELEDQSPASALLHASTSSSDSLERATHAARDALEKSGRYNVVDARLEAPPPSGWRNCDGCEAKAAARLGADESLLGIVRRATQTDYYVLVQIRDARTGRLLDEESANFAGGEEGWASGVRMLMKHQVLVAMAADTASAATASAATASAAPASEAPPASAATASAARPSEAPAPAATASTAPACKVALVNPVSGYAECVEPRGAPVAPAPPRPDSPRVRDAEN